MEKSCPPQPYLAVSLISTINRVYERVQLLGKLRWQGRYPVRQLLHGVPAQHLWSELRAALPRHKGRSGEGTQHPNPKSHYARRRSLSRFLVGLRLRVERQPDEDCGHAHHEIRGIPGTLRPERFHSGHHGRARDNGESEWRLHLQRFGQSGDNRARNRERDPRQFRYLFRIWSQSLYALCGKLARSVRAG